MTSEHKFLSFRTNISIILSRVNFQLSIRSITITRKHSKTLPKSLHRSDFLSIVYSLKSSLPRQDLGNCCYMISTSRLSWWLMLFKLLSFFTTPTPSTKKCNTPKGTPNSHKHNKIKHLQRKICRINKSHAVRH